MSPSILATLGVVVLAGVALAFQAPLNGALGRGIGSTTAAASVSFAVGLVLLVALTLGLGQGGAYMRVATVRPLLLTGGAMGAFYVWAALWGAPILGVVSAFAALILGQMVTALILDATGSFGLPVIGISWKRVVAVALVAAGVVMSRL